MADIVAGILFLLESPYSSFDLQLTIPKGKCIKQAEVSLIETQSSEVKSEPPTSDVEMFV